MAIGTPTILEIINTVTITSSNTIQTMAKGKTITKIIRRTTKKTSPREDSLVTCVVGSVSRSSIATQLTTINIDTPMRTKSAATTTNSNIGTTVISTTTGIRPVTIMPLIATALAVGRRLTTQTRVFLDREAVVEISRTGSLTRIGMKQTESAFSGSKLDEFET